ncbi:hypothetical protein AAKU67_000710 [Oxalobacteraceae bacterium GrIS 2.11]
MNQYQQVIQSAKKAALKKFSILVQRMAQNSDQELAKALGVNSATTDYYTLNGARALLRKSGDELLHNIETEYKKKIEQAIAGMYSDERVAVAHMTANNLTLIDDQIITRQIEVGHLVSRLSASCSESLAMLNFIISQMLEKADVKEKDNPFRPELIAHTLYEVLYDKVQDEKIRTFLLSYSTNSLALYLPEYYADLCEVFKSGGISPKLYTRPTLAGRQQEQSAHGSAYRPTEGGQASGTQNTDATPTLQRLLDQMQQRLGMHPNGTANPVAGDSVNVSPLAFQALLDGILGSSQGGPGVGPALASPASAELIARLNEFQRMAAQGRSVDGQIAPSGNQLFALGNQIDPALTTPADRRALDLMAVLFELMLRDEQLPAGMRPQLGQLQIPFLKSAVLDPSTLEQVDHPTRQLLNHMGMVSVGLAPDSELGQGVDSEIRRIIKKILDGFHDDTDIFVTCLAELKTFMAEELVRSDPVTKRNIAVMETVLRIGNLTYAITEAVREVLLPLNLDQRIVDFCLNIWVHVLVRASVRISNAKGDASKAIRAKLLLFFNALPDLVWSSQEKSSTSDRLELVKLLPKLVKIIQSGLNALHLSEEETKEAMDQLLAVHAQVLANAEGASGKPLPSLDELRQMFKVETIQEEATISKAIAPPPLDGRSIETAFTKKGIAAMVHISPPVANTAKVDYDWLSDMQVGTRVECKIDRNYHPARLIWVSNSQSLFMFRLDDSPNPIIYSPISLNHALGNGTLMFVETAPTFERAVESLLREVEFLKKIGKPLEDGEVQNYPN